MLKWAVLLILKLGAYFLPFFKLSNQHVLKKKTTTKQCLAYELSIAVSMVTCERVHKIREV